MTPNQITAFRVLVAFVAVGLFGHGAWANLAALVLVIVAIALDAVDGYVARRKRLATPLGAQLDIVGDRVIENLFLTYFAVSGLISIWVPVIFFVRGAATDFVRDVAARTGREGFGGNWLMETWWGKALVASRASRAIYGTLKCVCFCFLGLQLSLQAAPPAVSLVALLPVLEKFSEVLVFAAQFLVFATLALCLLRGLPVLWEGRRYLAAGPLAGARQNPAGAATR
jgi:CDP-diacylglycerol--glycerol-3-phosphate 3-phosphatidyltransferase